MGKLDPRQISDETFPRYLDTHVLPDPDLVIRTSARRGFPISCCGSRPIRSTSSSTRSGPISRPRSSPMSCRVTACASAASARCCDLRAAVWALAKDSFFRSGHRMATGLAIALRRAGRCLGRRVVVHRSGAGHGRRAGLGTGPDAGRGAENAPSSSAGWRPARSLPPSFFRWGNRAARRACGDARGHRSVLEGGTARSSL